MKQSSSCQTNLSPNNIKRYEEVLLKPHTYVPTYRKYICVYLLVFMLPSFKTNLSEKILLSVKQLHEERRTAEVEKCK